MKSAERRQAVGWAAGVAAVALIVAGCGDESGADSAAPSSATTAASDNSDAVATNSAQHDSPSASAKPQSKPEATDVVVAGADGDTVTLTGPIAAKYAAATPAQKKGLGVALTGDHNAGKRDSGLVYQQFKGGVITARNDHPDTPAYITWGKIRDTWNVERAPDGTPDDAGMNGSAGPLGAPTSDEKTVGGLKEATFEHGKIVYDTRSGKLTVTVKGRVVPSK